MLGPPVCIRCMCLMKFIDKGPWKCPSCGIDHKHEDCENLFMFSPAQQDAICGDDEELKSILKDLQDLALR